MYPRARAKGGLQGGGQGDGDAAAGAAQPMALPLVSDGVVSSNTAVGPSEPPNSIPHNPGSHYSPTVCDNRQHVHASQQHQPPPPPPMLHMSSGMYFERMQDMCVSSPPPPPPHFFAGNMHHHGGNVCGGMHRRTMSTSYDQQSRPVPPPHVNCYQGDRIAGTSGSATVRGAMQVGFSVSMAFPSTITQVPFSQRSRASSGCMPRPPTGVASPVDAACRPPPLYGEADLDSSTGAAASATNDISVVSLNHEATPLSRSLANTAKATRRWTCMTPSAMRALDRVNTALNVPAPPLPSSASAGAPIMQMRSTGSCCLTATPVGAAVPGVTSLKTTLHESASLAAASAPLSPLINSPSLVQQQSPQPHSQVPQQRSAEPSPVVGVDIADTDSNVAWSSFSGKGLAKPTMVQAEARYRYLYEEFRKFNRLRVKLVEESERMKREQALLRQELDYYRRKTASAAEEREALLADYRDDLHDVLRLAQVLAVDAVAAYPSDGDASHSAFSTEGGGRNVPVSSPQEALDAAMARISASNILVAAAAAAAPPALPSTGVPAPPSLPQEAVGFSEPRLSRIAEHLGLRYGRWMPMPSAAPRSLIMDTEPRNPSPSASPRSETGPQHMQSVLLRDEMRDVHCSTHAAMSAYMNGLDYGISPIFSQRSYPPGVSQKPPHQQHHFSSEYCGLHFHVDVPRLHAHTACGVLDPANAEKDDAGGQSTLVHGACSHSPPEEQQPSPDLAPRGTHTARPLV
ncbi:hypothetical protein JIQ42_07009 [Leishmania sp. Namibia]|uniref:hypothetical protein n=1 Tax=Leishmania sp. Namibia TaxID=2802991 RepID=UPI001B5D9FF3|nr:hypothetical protein JIQ42_07009 [Leishmania sp. Namibia]